MKPTPVAKGLNWVSPAPLRGGMLTGVRHFLGETHGAG